MMFLLLLLFTTPVLAEGELEMFEEICEITGEVRTGYRLREIEIKTQTLNPISLQQPSEQQNAF